MKGVKRHMKIISMVFQKKDFVQDELAILGLKMAQYHNSEPSLRVIFLLSHN